MRFLKACVPWLLLFLYSTPTFAGDPQWVEVRSPNFSVITDAGEKKGRDVALHFEQMRSVFGKLVARGNVNLSVPLQIVAFRNTKEMRQVAPIFNGKPTELAGLFQGGEDRSFIMLDMSVENPWSVVFHEYAHRLMDGNISIHTDPWFEEGFAEFFSSIEVDNKEARVGKIPDQTYQILQQVGMMKVTDLLRVQHNTKTYNESGDHRTTFYAESALLVHYVYDNSLIPKVWAYFEAVQVQKKPVDESIQLAFGMTAEQLDKTLRNYLSTGKYRYYSIPTPTGIVASEFVAGPVSLADAHATLADIHAHSPDYRDKALVEFQEVLKMDPDNTQALRGMGFAYLQHQDFQNAADYLRRAAQRDSKDPRVHFYYAMLLTQQGPQNEASSAEIKKELETSIALDPKLADAYSMLGYTQAFSGEPEKGMATLKKALELSPRNERYLYNLANVYMLNHKVDEAITIFRFLSGSSDPAVAIQSSQTLAQAITFKEHTSNPEVRLENRTVQNTEAFREPAEHHGDQEVATTAHVTGAPVRFVKGKLLSVDCSTAPQALLDVAAGTKSVKLHIRDSAHVILLGADAFSCAWKGKSVAVNYREGADGVGDVVSLEIQ
ncbi:MAG TPA: tetratricopeptide repeat protein [Terriglobales bacterium]|nr:tetratricopeptide repeat protein [Terriglobales bacterium]